MGEFKADCLVFSRATLAALVLWVAGCATQNIPRDYALDSAKGEGLVIGSITYAGSYSGYQVLYHRQPEGKAAWFQAGATMTIIPYVPDGDFPSSRGDGIVFAAALPAGDYVATDWSVGSGAARVDSTVPFKIEFHVEPGKAVYLGNFEFTQTARMGLTVTGARVVYQDAAQRDLPKFRAKYPNLAMTPIASAIAPGFRVEMLGGAYHTTITIVVPIG